MNTAPMTRAERIAQARARITAGLSESARERIAECGRLADALHGARGISVGIAASSGQFAVVESSHSGRRTIHAQLTGWQSYDECLSYMHSMVAGGDA